MDFTSEEYFELNEKIVNELTSVENLLVVISEKLYSIGLLLFKNETKRRKLKNNPIVISSIILIFLMREVLSLLMNDRNISLMLGDFAFNWRLKSMWNLVLITSVCIALSNQIIHLIYHRMNYYPFQIAYSSVQASLDMRQKVLLKFLNFTIKILTPFVFTSISVLSFYFNTTLFHMVLIGIPTSIFNAVFAIPCCQLLLWPIIHFYLTALKFKLQLKLENNRLNYLRIKLSNRVLALNLNKTLTGLDQILSTIVVSNKFWSKYLLNMCSGFGLTISIIIAQLFSDSDTYIMIAFIYVIIVIILSICVLLYSAIRVNNEANNSLKIFYKILFDSKAKSIALKHKIKV